MIEAKIRENFRHFFEKKGNDDKGKSNIIAHTPFC